MAYTGTGTQTDPFIVDNWDDFKVCAGSTNAGSYVKWADSDIKVCDISSAVTVILYCQEVDFNGWNFINVNGSNKYGYFWLYNATSIKNGVFSGNVTADRLFYARHANNIYITNIYVDITITSNETSTVKIFDGNNSRCLCFFDKCILKIAQNRGSYAVDYFYFSGVNSHLRFENSEIDINLSKNIPNANSSGLFDKYGGYTYFKNSYIHGNIGDYGVIFPIDSYTHSISYNSIFEFETNSGALTFGRMSNPIHNTEINPIYDTVSTPDDPYIISLVVSSDTQAIGHSGTAESENQLSAMLIDKANITYNNIFAMRFPAGSQYSFKIQQDDGVRYSKFGNTNTENWKFRIDEEINDNFPFLPFWKYTVAPPETVEPVPVQTYIRVHDGNAVRTAENKSYNFQSNGIRIVRPLSCKVTEELNGLYICELEHITDTDGDWLTLSSNNIISVPIIYHDKETQQLFRITETNVSASRKTVQVTARHIFYDLLARAIVSASVNNLSAYSSLYYLFNAVYVNQDEYEPVNLYWYPYQYSSDITEIYSAEYELTNLVACILGEDNSLINQLGGEIYRDNFYFSINHEKENCIKNENVISYAVDMTDIDVTINWENFCNYLVAYDNFGGYYAVSYDNFYGGELGKICKALKFNYDVQNYDRLVKDTNAYFSTVAVPDATYNVTFAKLKNTELYKDFIGLKNNEVGDTVRIKHYQLNVDISSKIIKKVYDVMRQETESITLGTAKASVFKPSFLSDTIYKTAPDVRALQKQLGG